MMRIKKEQKTNQIEKQKPHKNRQNDKKNDKNI